MQAKKPSFVPLMFAGTEMKYSVTVKARQGDNQLFRSGALGPDRRRRAGLSAGLTRHLQHLHALPAPSRLQDIVFDGMGKRSGLWVEAIGVLALVNVDFRRCGMGLHDGDSVALYAASTPTTVVGGTFSGNSASVGAAIYVNDRYKTSRTALHVSGATFSGNKVRGGLAGGRACARARAFASWACGAGAAQGGVGTIH